MNGRKASIPVADDYELKRVLQSVEEIGRLKTERDVKMKEVMTEIKEMRKKLDTISVRLSETKPPGERLVILEEKEKLVVEIQDKQEMLADIQESFAERLQSAALSPDDLRILRGINALKKEASLHEDISLQYTPSAGARRVSVPTNQPYTETEERDLQEKAIEKKEYLHEFLKARHEQAKLYNEKRKKFDKKIIRLEKSRCVALVEARLESEQQHRPEEIETMLLELNQTLKIFTTTHVNIIQNLDEKITEHTLTQEEDSLVRGYYARKKEEEEKKKRALKTASFSATPLNKVISTEKDRFRAERSRMVQEQALRGSVKEASLKVRELERQHEQKVKAIREELNTMQEGTITNIQQKMSLLEQLELTLEQHESTEGTYHTSLNDRTVLMEQLQQLERTADKVAQRGLEAMHKMKEQAAARNFCLQVVAKPEREQRELYMYATFKQRLLRQVELWMKKETRKLAESKMAAGRTLPELEELQKAAVLSRDGEHWDSKIEAARGVARDVVRREGVLKTEYEARCALCNLNDAEREAVASSTRKKVVYTPVAVWSEKTFTDIFTILKGTKDLKALLAVCQADDESTTKKKAPQPVVDTTDVPDALIVSAAGVNTPFAGTYTFLGFTEGPVWGNGNMRISLQKKYWLVSMTSEEMEAGKGWLRSDTMSYGGGPHRMKGWVSSVCAIPVTGTWHQVAAISIVGASSRPPTPPPSPYSNRASPVAGIKWWVANGWRADTNLPSSLSLPKIDDVSERMSLIALLSSRSGIRHNVNTPSVHGDCVCIRLAPETVGDLCKDTVEGKERRVRYVGCIGEVVCIGAGGTRIVFQDGGVASFPVQVCDPVSPRPNHVSHDIRERVIAEETMTLLRNEAAAQREALGSLNRTGACLEGFSLPANLPEKPYPPAAFSTTQQEESYLLRYINAADQLCLKVLSWVRSWIKTSKLSQTISDKSLKQFYQSFNSICLYAHIARKRPLSEWQVVEAPPVQSQTGPVTTFKAKHLMKAKMAMEPPRVVHNRCALEDRPWPPLEDEFPDSLRYYPRRPTSVKKKRGKPVYKLKRNGASRGLPKESPVPKPPVPPAPWRTWRQAKPPENAMEAITHMLRNIQATAGNTSF